MKPVTDERGMKLHNKTDIDFDIKRLAGDASDRTYYRLTFKNENAFPKSVVLMKLACAFNEQKIDFIKLRRFLSECNITVPEIYLTKPERGFIYLEDCGDELLADRAAKAGKAEVVELYKKAIDMLIVLQIEGTRRVDDGNPANARRFDTEKYMAELRHTANWFIKGHLKKKLGPDEEKKLEEFFHRLVSPLEKEPMVFAHRDYHARNILIKENRLYLLDFQDARMGPAQYDLASLLYDSYVKLADAVRRELLNYYLGRWSLTMKKSPDPEAFEATLKRQSLQRSLKALGTFGYQAVEKNNLFYLQFVPQTVGYIRENLSVLDGSAENSDWIFSLITE